jgi:hypothetical protein
MYSSNGACQGSSCAIRSRSVLGAGSAASAVASSTNGGTGMILISRLFRPVVHATGVAIAAFRSVGSAEEYSIW